MKTLPTDRATIADEWTVFKRGPRGSGRYYSIFRRHWHGGQVEWYCGEEVSVITLGVCPESAWCFRSKGEMKAKLQELNR